MLMAKHISFLPSLTCVATTLVLLAFLPATGSEEACIHT